MAKKANTENRLERSDSSDNKSNVQTFLLSAISDVAGNLKLLDTKVSIMLATAGVITGLIVACKTNILKAYKFYSAISVTNILFISLVVVCSLFLTATFYFGLKTITVKTGKSQKKSLWFFSPEYDKITDQQYRVLIHKLTDSEIINQLADELYKLNSINSKKMKNTKVAVSFFAAFCGMNALIMALVGLFYLIV